MSKHNRSLALEEIQELKLKLEELLPARHPSMSSVSSQPQPARHVVKVTGNITVSF